LRSGLQKFTPCPGSKNWKPTEDHRSERASNKGINKFIYIILLQTIQKKRDFLFWGLLGCTHELLVVGLGEFLKPGGRYEGDGDGGKALELDHDTLALLDALDGAYGIFEIALGDAHSLAGFRDEIGVFQEMDAAVGVLIDTHEVLHLAVGDDEHPVLVVLGKKVGTVVHRLKLPARHLELGELLTGGADEDQAIDCRNVGLVDIPVVCFLVFDAHGHEVLELQLVEHLLKAHHALGPPIRDTHGKPL